MKLGIVKLASMVHWCCHSIGLRIKMKLLLYIGLLLAMCYIINVD